MSFAASTIIAGRYELVDSLGSGAMGEVWKARDTRFESRLVAIKLLKEDETLREDARNRAKFQRTVEQEARSGALTVNLIVNMLDDILICGEHRPQLQKRIEERLAGSSCTTEDAVRLFDEFVGDATFNENARVRAKMRKLFRDEANSVANLRHDNIVAISDYGDYEGVPFLVMDYIEGRTLYQVIQRGELVSRTRQLQLMEDLCAGLGYAHKKHLVHRDVKPANLIIDSSTDSLKVLDFGVVRRLESSGESTVGIPIGTFCYMSPEQTQGAATLDHRSDIFSVGSVFYEVLTGRKAFPPTGTVTDLIARVMRDQPIPLTELVKDLEPGIEPIVMKALEKKPDRRYQDLASMERDIARVRARLEQQADMAERTVVLPAAEQTVVVDRRPAVKIQGLLTRARGAFATGDDHAVLEFCDQVLKIDAEHRETIELRKRAADRLDQVQIEPLAREAGQLLIAGQLTAAADLLKRARELAPQSDRVNRLQQTLDGALAERERAAVAAKRIQDLLTKARQQLRDGQYEQAQQVAAAIIDLDPAHQESLDILNDARAAIARAADDRAAAAAADAQRRADEMVRGGRLDEAIAFLEAVTPSRPEIDARIVELRQTLDAELAKARKVAQGIREARAAFERREFQQALDTAKRVLALQPGDVEAGQIADKATFEIEALAVLANAEAQASTGNLEQAVRLLEQARPGHPAIEKRIAEYGKQREAEAKNKAEQDRLRAEREAAELERKREQERLRAAQEAEEARVRAEREAEEKRLRAEKEAEEAKLRVEREAAEKERRRIADAVAQISDLIRQGQLPQATTALQAFATSDPNVPDLPRLREQLAKAERDAEEARLRAEREAEEVRVRAQREAEEARIRAEQERERKRVADAVARISELTRKGQLPDATAAIEALAASNPEVAELPRLREQLAKAERAAEEARLRAEREAFDKRAEQHVKDARKLVKQGQLDEALKSLRAFTPTHPSVDEEIPRVEQAIKDRAEAKAREEREAEARRQAEADSKAALATARAFYEKEAFAEAIATLEAVATPTDELTKMLAAVRRQVAKRKEAAEEAARKAAEAARLEAERLELDRRVAAMLKEARDARKAGDLGTALDRATEAKKLLPADLAIDGLATELLASLKSAVAANPKDAALLRLLQKYDPAARKSKQMQLAGFAAAAVLVLAIGGYFVMNPPFGGDTETPQQTQTTAPPAANPNPPPTTATAPTTTPAVQVETPVVQQQPPPAPGLATVTFDVQPWARVRIVALNKTAKVPAEPQLTPFALDLEEGEYQVVLENDVTKPLTVPLRVVAGKSQTLRTRMPGFNPASVVETLLGQER